MSVVLWLLLRVVLICPCLRNLCLTQKIFLDLSSQAFVSEKESVLIIYLAHHCHKHYLSQN